MRQATVVSYEQLAALPYPESLGPRHQPVHHCDYVDCVKAEINRRGFTVEKETYTLAREGLQMFGTLVLWQGVATPDNRAMMVGLRSGNDRSRSLQMVAGFHVFVCANGCFSGDTVALGRKHTNGVRLTDEVRGGFDRWLGQVETLGAALDNLHTRPVTEAQARQFLCTAVLKGVIPGSALPKVHAIWSKPTYEEHSERTAHTLYQAFTEYLRDETSVAASLANQRLGQLMLTERAA